MMRRAVATIRALLKDERGNVIALTAIGIPLILGSAALAVDTIQWAYGKRDLQAAADAAAMAGVYGLIQNGDMDNAVDKSVSANADLDPKRAVAAEQSPAGHEGDPFAVKVQIAVPARTTFARLFMRSAPTITAEATATVVENGEFCAFAIGSDDETGLLIDPSSDVDMECGLATNASSSKAIEADSSAVIRADNIVAFGGIDAKGIKSDRVRPYGVRQKDPLAGRRAAAGSEHRLPKRNGQLRRGIDQRRSGRPRTRLLRKPAARRPDIPRGRRIYPQPRQSGHRPDGRGDVQVLHDLADERTGRRPTPGRSARCRWTVERR